jgi:hypothetical protein
MTRARTGVTAVVVAVLVAVSVGNGGARALAAAAPDEDLNNRGVDLRRAGKDSEALAVFQQAYDLTHSPRATAQLGLAYQALGRWEMAAPLVEKALQSPGDPWIKKYLQQLQDTFSLIKQHLARIELTGEPAGAEVVVNGTVAGHLPLSGPLPVSIGTVDLQVRAPGYRDDIRKLNLTAFQYQRTFVRLDKLPEVAAATVVPPVVDPPGGGGSPPIVTPPPKDTEPSAVSPRTVAKWTALGLAVAGVGTGVAASVIYNQKVNDFNNESCREKNGAGVDKTTGAANPACQSLLGSYNSARTWQIVGFSAAGAFAVTWLVLQLTEPRATPTSVASWNCAPSLLQAGGFCALRF